MQAMAATMAIMQEGKISKTSKGDQYCFHSITNSGVEISVTKQKSGTETFFIRKALSGTALKLSRDRLGETSIRKQTK